MSLASRSLILTFSSIAKFVSLRKTFDKEEYPLQDKTYLLNGIAMQIHRILGRGFSEIVYKDAFELELRNRGIPYEREKEYTVEYKGVILPHRFFADFVVFNDIIVEIKAQKGIVDEHYNQVLNYLAVSKCKVGLIYNFGERSLITKRVILIKDHISGKFAN